MIKKLLALTMTFVSCVMTFATDMVVKQKNGETLRFDVKNVEEVIFEESIPEETAIVDTSETPLKFKILSDSTVEVINDDSYRDALIDTISIPSKVRIDGKVYSVTSIGNYAFQICSSLTNINIPKSVTFIGLYAFTCSGLTSINIPEGVTSINCWTFEGCTNLTSVKIPESVTTISYYAFSKCRNLTSINIPDSLTTIDNHAFEDCSGLTSIKIPESVTTISDNAFYGCSGLTSINIPNGITSIESSTFAGCSSLTSINIPDSVIYIKSRAFEGCSSLTSINIPDSVFSIDNHAFEGCSSLTSINVASNNPMYSSENGILYNKNKTEVIFIPDGIEPQLFIYDNGTKCYGWVGNKEKCTEVVIPDGVTSIEVRAFSGCNNLTSISIPESVTRIKIYAFKNCTNLDVVIDNSEKNVKVGTEAFEGCKSVTWLKD